MVTGVTRSWHDQPSSCLDQIWMNTPERLISCKNITRSFSDHNLVTMSFCTKDKIENTHIIVKRDRKSFDLRDYNRKICDLDWSGYFESRDIDHINNIFEQNILSVLNIVAPVKFIQSRENFRSWVTAEVKEELKSRNRLRELARRTDIAEDWNVYRSARNKCVKLLSKLKKE